MLPCVFEGQFSNSMCFAIVMFELFTTAPSINFEILILPRVFEGEFLKSTYFTQLFLWAAEVACRATTVHVSCDRVEANFSVLSYIYVVWWALSLRAGAGRVYVSRGLRRGRKPGRKSF